MSENKFLGLSTNNWITIIIFILGAAVTYLLAFPNIKSAGPIKIQKVENKSIPSNKNVQVWHVTYVKPFKNYGLLKGKIDDVRIVPLGLTPKPKVNVVYIDRKPISFLAKEDIECSLVLYFSLPEQTQNLGFQLVYYDQDGNEVEKIRSNLNTEKNLF